LSLKSVSDLYVTYNNYYVHVINCLGSAVRNAYGRRQTSTSCQCNTESPITARQGACRRQTPGLNNDVLSRYGLPEQPTTENKNLVVQRSHMVFLGEELVDWLQWQVPRLSRRSDAVNYARQLLVDGLIYRVHVEDCHRDTSKSFHERCLYAFTPEPCDMHRTNWRRCLRPNVLERMFWMYNILGQKSGRSMDRSKWYEGSWSWLHINSGYATDRYWHS